MFTSYPPNYSPLYSELTYTFTTSSESDITIYLTDVTSNDIFGVKKFYSTTTAQVNVAPILRPLIYPVAEKLETGFASSTNRGAVTIQLSDAEGNVAPSRVFALSKQTEDQIGLVSTFDAEGRALSLGECEMLRFRITPGVDTFVYVRQYLYGQDSVAAGMSYTMLEGTVDGFINFNVAATPFEAIEEQADQLETITVTVMQNNSTVASVSYSIIDPPHEPTRLVWISSRGSLESYTFPVVRERVRSHKSGESARTTLTLGSAYETYAVRQALAEIIDSPTVWVFMGDEYREALSVSSSVVMSPIDELATIEMEITYEEE